MEFEKLERTSVPALDEILGIPFKVLDDGFIRVIDYMGNDTSIVQAARVSYGKGTKKLHEDQMLIRYLLRHHHTTPFEMCEIKFHIRVPMDCWRQWIRHRTANVNEYSTRYSIAIDAAQRTQPHEWRKQATVNRQGSEGFIDEHYGTYLTAREKELQEFARLVYNERLEAGVAREQARKDLPLSTYTEAYWKIDLHNLLHFLALRMESNAQYEIRQYATVIGNEIVNRWCPITWKAFRDYIYEGIELSSFEIALIAKLHQNDIAGALVLAREYGIVPPEGEPLNKNIEREEISEKLRKLGITPPWDTL
ncbi:MAG: FAD-dependent thymidylate synthase [Bacteroidetes bacterium]|nr:FAD-dependent thymidylate synthase [Bacteroidota bacterium]